MPWSNDRASRARSNKTYDHRWRKARADQLKRQPRCELGLDGCTIRATEVDHVIGAAADPDHRHLRSVCTPCHRKVTAQQGGGYRGRGSTPDPEPRPSTQW